MHHVKKCWKMEQLFVYTLGLAMHKCIFICLYMFNVSRENHACALGEG